MDPYFILPLLMGASTYLMQALNPQVGDPMQVRIMKLMPIMFTVLFFFSPRVSSCTGSLTTCSPWLSKLMSIGR